MWSGLQKVILQDNLQGENYILFLPIFILKTFYFTGNFINFF